MHSRKFILTLYCLVYGQMSHWGKEESAWNVLFLICLINNSLILNINNKNIKDKKIIKRVESDNNNIPLNKDILSIINGCLLGDSYGEKVKDGKETRFIIYQEGSHKDYLYILHKLILDLGFCKKEVPKIKSRLGKGGKIKQTIKFETFSNEIFNSIYNEWYKESKKVIPSKFELYLTPLCLAIWIMDYRCVATNKGLNLRINNFRFKEVYNLVYLLEKKYDLKSSIEKIGENEYNIYILKESIIKLNLIVKDYIVPSMKYKIYNCI